MKGRRHTQIGCSENEIRADIAPGSGIKRCFALHPLNPCSPIYPYTPSSGASTVRLARNHTSPNAASWSFRQLADKPAKWIGDWALCRPLSRTEVA